MPVNGKGPGRTHDCGRVLIPGLCSSAGVARGFDRKVARLLPTKKQPSNRLPAELSRDPR